MFDIKLYIFIYNFFVQLYKISVNFYEGFKLCLRTLKSSVFLALNFENCSKNTLLSFFINKIRLEIDETVNREI